MTIFGEIIFYLFLITIPIVAISWMYKDKFKKEKKAWYESKRNIVLSILVPKENEKKPIAAEQMFASLHGIFRTENKFQDQISFELVAKDKYIQFYVCLPDYLKDFVEGQIYAQYPDVEIFEVPDYTEELNIEQNSVASARLTLVKNDVYPIKTFTSFEVDPLSAITSVFSKVEEGEQIWLQMIIKPISDAWQLKGISHVASIKAGKSSSESGKNILKNIGKFIIKLIVEVFKNLFAMNSQAGEGTEVKLSGPEEEALKEIERKSTKLGFETRMRLVSICKDKVSARVKIESVVAAFKQFSTTNLNALEVKKISTSPLSIESYKKRRFYDQGFIFNIEELASIYHLPTTSVETPNIVWAGSKKGEPPSNLPVIGTVPDLDLTLLAKTNFRNIEKTFGIKRRDRSLHMYVIGKTGTGKSTLMENMVIDDIKKGQGVAYIDPHGDAIDHILKHIPKERKDDVVYFSPADKDWPIAFNPLEAVNPELKNIVASGVLGIFKKIFGESWGPRLEYILRNALLAAVDYPGSTLLSVMRLLTDQQYRKKVTSTINDSVVRDFFNNEFDKYDPKFQREAIAPIQNKVGQFLSSPTIRNIVGQAKSSIDLYDLMNSQKIMLVDLSIGKIGEDSSALLGAMIITKFQLAAMQRANIPMEMRKDFYLYVDEFQNFATDSFAVILSEARKYRLNLIMTNQYIAQMPEKVAKAIFGNVGTMISFRVGASDAASLVKEFEPVFTANDLVNLNNYNIYVKMAIDGVTRPAFSAITLAPDKETELTKNVVESIIDSSRNRYSTPKTEVEEKLKVWNEEVEKARIEAEVFKNQKKRQKYNNKINISRNIDAISQYYTFVDKNGDKWYIPKVKTNEQEKDTTSINKDEKEQKNKITIEKKLIKSKVEDLQKNKKRPKFKPIIADKFDKQIKKINKKIIDGKITDELLVSIEELEKHLSKKKK